jgi:hypothetical protein
MCFSHGVFWAMLWINGAEMDKDEELDADEPLKLKIGRVACSRYA